MRSDVVETTYEVMAPEFRALIAYEPNGALDRPTPQEVYDGIRSASPVVRWELGVGFLSTDDVVVGVRQTRRLPVSWV